MKTIRISAQVWEEIARRGKFGETPDQVLRRTLHLPAKSPSAGSFWRSRTAEEIAREQRAVPVRKLEDISGRAGLWKDDEEFQAYVGGIYRRRAQSRTRTPRGRRS